jgi:hypothetical protein
MVVVVYDDDGGDVVVSWWVGVGEEDGKGANETILLATCEAW